MSNFKLVSDGCVESVQTEMNELKLKGFFRKAHSEQVKRDKRKKLTLVCNQPKTWKYV